MATIPRLKELAGELVGFGVHHAAKGMLGVYWRTPDGWKHLGYLKSRRGRRVEVFAVDGSSRGSVENAGEGYAMLRGALKNPRASRAPAKRAYRARFVGGSRRGAVTFLAKSDAAAVRYATGLLRAKLGARRCVSVKRAGAPSSSGGRRGRRSNPTSRAELESAARAFEDFTGHEASRVERHKGVEHRAGWLLGRVAAISYIATRDGETAEYVHRFKRRSRPQLVSSHDGSQLYLLGGAYSVTDRGIEDA